MDLTTAEKLAEEVSSELSPYCTQLKVAGSIRRRRPQVHDIDIVCIPGNQGRLALKLKAMGCKYGGHRLARFTWAGKGPDVSGLQVQVDIYFATLETWATLLLIRTGSKENNIRLCSLAREKGWKLHAGGEGIFDENGLRVAYLTEESIYRALGLGYQPPSERN